VSKIFEKYLKDQNITYENKNEYWIIKNLLLLRLANKRLNMLVKKIAYTSL